MRLFVIRHGETQWNRERRIQGLQDIPLLADGREQIRQVCRTLASAKEDVRLARIFTSPLLRAAQSAFIAGEFFQVPVQVMPSIRERAFGRLEGLTWQEIRERYGIADVEEIQDGQLDIEALAAVRDRVVAAAEFLAASYPQKDILLVTHGSIIKCLGQAYGKEVGILPNAAYMELMI
ncbi:histidine phosphatase family protein [Brevibacillus migulae]|uniref:histidine phosphatase family protein n=1 Tax=Brevibacillus migulae TaxID=1644114 RepID=UPI00106E1C82|nr:histidine phosphatase family protein [Brevibacillus migulae]